MRLGAAILLTFVVLAAAAPSASAAEATVTATKDGWWSQASPLPSSVPANAIGVGAQAGSPDKVAAVGITLDVPEGSTVESLGLLLRESPESGTQLNNTSAAMVACPATADWSSVKNGPLANQPKFDCDLAKADGFRTQAGVWRFDLTALAQLWTGSLAQNGVVLLENVAAPNAFQVSLQDVGTRTMAFELVATEAPAEPAAPTESPPSGTAGDQPVATEPSLAPAPSLEPVPLPSGGEATVPEVRLAQPAARRGGTEAAVGAGDLTEDIPLGVLLLLPLLLGFGYIVCFTLGPAGDPASFHRREGGVSRAMARRAASDTTTTTGRFE